MAALSSPVRPPAGASKRRRKAHPVFAGITLPVGSPKLPTPLSGVALPRRFRVAPSWSGGSSEPSERLPWHATRAFCTRSSGRLRTPCRFLTMVCPATIRKKTRSSAAPPFIPRNRIPKRLGTLPHANPATRPPRTCARGATPSLDAGPLRTSLGRDVPTYSPSPGSYRSCEHPLADRVQVHCVTSLGSTRCRCSLGR